MHEIKEHCFYCWKDATHVVTLRGMDEGRGRVYYCEGHKIAESVHLAQDPLETQRKVMSELLKLVESRLVAGDHVCSNDNGDFLYLDQIEGVLDQVRKELGLPRLART